MALFDRCLDALGNNVTILSKEEGDIVFELMLINFPSAGWARLDWEKIKKSKKIVYIHEIIEALKLESESIYPIYITWDNTNFPTIKTDIISALNALEDVIEISFDTWFYSPKEGYVIEFFHDGETMIGWTE